MATWTDIDAFTASQLLTKDLAELLRTNQDFLKNPPSYLYTRGFGDADYTTVAVAFELIDGTNMDETITTFGGDVIVRFSARLLHSTTGWGYFEIYVDGSPISNDTDTGLGGIRPTYAENVAIHKRVTGLAAGSHTFAMYWQTDTGTATLDRDSMIQFEIRED